MAAKQMDGKSAKRYIFNSVRDTYQGYWKYSYINLVNGSTGHHWNRTIEAKSSLIWLQYSEEASGSIEALTWAAHCMPPIARLLRSCHCHAGATDGRTDGRRMLLQRPRRVFLPTGRGGGPASRILDVLRLTRASSPLPDIKFSYLTLRKKYIHVISVSKWTIVMSLQMMIINEVSR